MHTYAFRIMIRIFYIKIIGKAYTYLFSKKIYLTHDEARVNLVNQVVKSLNLTTFILIDKKKLSTRYRESVQVSSLKTFI